MRANVLILSLFVFLRGRDGWDNTRVIFFIPLTFFLSLTFTYPSRLTWFLVIIPFCWGVFFLSFSLLYFWVRFLLAGDQKKI